MPRLTTMLTLTGVRPGRERDLDALEHVGDREVDVVHRAERRVVERVERHRHAIQAGVGEPRGHARQQRAVRRQRDVVDAGQRGEARDQLVDAAAHERLAAGDAQLLDAHAGERARQALDLLERQQLLAAQELELLAEDLLGHAVHAAEVAAVGDRDAQVANRPGELVESDGHQLQYRAGAQ